MNDDRNPLPIAVSALMGIALLVLVGCDSLPPPRPPQAVSVPPPAGPAGEPYVAAPTLPAPDNQVVPFPSETGDPEVPSLLPYLTRPDSGTDPTAPSVPPPPPATPGVVRVGLLLPMSGANEALGRSMLNAAQMAVFDLADDRFELMPQDTVGTANGAARAAQRAIGDGADLILGPLLAGSVRAVAPTAAAAGVPVVAFSSDRSVAGEDVYVMGFVPDAEVRRVVTHAYRQGITRFAALVPDSPYGTTVLPAFEDAVADVGGMVVDVALFDPAGADFADVVRQLARYDARRQDLIAQRDALKARGGEASRRALARLERLETLGDLPFDGLLVAAGGKTLEVIGAHLPYFDVDPTRVQMLGTGQWDEPGLGAEPALVGGLFAAPPPEARAAFEQRYRTTFGEPPARLATLAYDAAALAAVLARRDAAQPFSPDAITQPSGFAGRDGIFRFHADGVAERGLAVLRVAPRSVDVVDPAPTSFGGS